MIPKTLPIVPVAAAVVRRGGRIMAARRSKGRLAGLWEFPGGKIEVEESPESCLGREIQEELGICIRVGEHVLSTLHEYPEITVELIAFEAEWISGEITLQDHDKVVWLDPGDLESLDWAPADLPIVRVLGRSG